MLDSEGKYLCGKKEKKMKLFSNPLVISGDQFQILKE